MPSDKEQLQRSKKLRRETAEYFDSIRDETPESIDATHVAVVDFLMAQGCEMQAAYKIINLLAGDKCPELKIDYTVHQRKDTA